MGIFNTTFLENKLGSFLLCCSIGGMVAGAVLFHPEWLGLCEFAYEYVRNCLWGRDVSRGLGEPLFLYALCVLPLSLILLPLSRIIKRKVLRFSLLWIPLSFLVITLTPVTSGSWSPIYTINKEMVSWIMGGSFTVISLIIALVTSIRNKP